MAFYAIGLLVGVAVGLKAGARELFVFCTLLVLAAFAGSLYLGDSLWTATLRAIATAVLMQVGFFAALLLRSVTHGPEHEAAAMESRRQRFGRTGGDPDETVTAHDQRPTQDRRKMTRHAEAERSGED